MNMLVRKLLKHRRHVTAHILIFVQSASHFIMSARRTRGPGSAPVDDRQMVHVAKQATQDGTFTVYLGDRPVAWGLTRHAADALIQRLLQR
jgi:hypothetical protein